MRFKDPEPNSRREITFFAWLPITIGVETRWLEKVIVMQIRSRDRRSFSSSHYYWEDIGFLDVNNN